MLSKLEKLLTERKLKLYEVATVRVYLAADGRDGADFDGWERAYRRYFANVDRDTGRSLLTEPVETTALSAPVDPSGSAAGPASGAARPAERPSARPSTSGVADPSATDGATTSAAESSTETSSGASPVTELYPGTDNRTRPTLVTVGVAQQPVAGWLVQVEIEAVHGAD